MNQETLQHIREVLTRERRVTFFDGFETYLASLSRGDRFLFWLLALLCVAASLYALRALQVTLLREVPSYGGSLVEGAVGSPQFMNPLLAISDADRDLTALTYAGLMGLTGKGELVGVVAERYTRSDDGKTYTFFLRPDARFSDGSPIRADDVVYTIKKAQDPSLKSPEYANWSGVSALALDAHTVRFTLAKPYAPFLANTTLGILPQHLWQNIGNNEFPFTTLETSPIGAGPFKVQSVSRDASGLIRSVSLTANRYYPLGRPFLDRLTIKFFPQENDLVSAVRSGVVESAYDVPTSGAHAAPYARVFGVFWNLSDKKVFARLEVRKALSLAIDRPELISSALRGYATPIMGPVPPGSSVEETEVPTAGNPTAEAAKILTSAGWSYDTSARSWKQASAKESLGQITLRTSNVPELKAVAEQVKLAWQKLGIRVEVELYEPGDLSQNVIRPRKYEALLYGMVIGRDLDLYAFWHSGERNDPGLNIAGYANKTVDALLEEARSSGDESLRVGDLQKIQDAVAADYPAAFIYAPSFTYTTPLDVSGVDLPQIITPSDRFASVASWYRVTDRVWPFFSK